MAISKEEKYVPEVRRLIEAGHSQREIAETIGEDRKIVQRIAKKHNLSSNHPEHLRREQAKQANSSTIHNLEFLKELVDRGLSTRAIAKEANTNLSSVRYWLSKYDLKTQWADVNAQQVDKWCNKHNEAKRICEGGKRLRCKSCANEASKTSYQKMSEDKKKLKGRLKQERLLSIINEAGGKCLKCGYNKCIAALHFHHKIPSEKLFSISNSLGSSLDILRLEAKKCELLCANCHNLVHMTHFSLKGLGIKHRTATRAADCKNQDHANVYLQDTKHGKIEYCLDCRRGYHNHRKASIKYDLVKMLGGKCVKCSFNKNPLLLQFHHINPEDKVFNFASNFHRLKKEQLVNEANKCELMCPNCHAEYEYSS